MDQLNQILNSLLSLLSLTNGSQISNNSTTSTEPTSGPSTDTINNFLQELEMNEDHHQSTSKRDTDEKKQHVQKILQKLRVLTQVLMQTNSYIKNTENQTTLKNNELIYMDFSCFMEYLQGGLFLVVKSQGGLFLVIFSALHLSIVQYDSILL